jgi:hypothetical protein
MEQPGPTVTINLNTLRRNADRQREDAETIAQLCDGLNSSIQENGSLKASVKKLEEEKATLTARLFKYEPQPAQDKAKP